MATSGPNTAGTGADDAGVGTLAWSNPTRITADDASYATASDSAATTHYLKGTNFGFAIPPGATINGVQLEFDVLINTRITDSTIKLVKGGTVSGDNKSTGGTWSGSGLRSYGGSSDLWGLTLTPTDINDSTFGAVISVAISAGDAPGTASVDYMRITITYTAASGPANLKSYNTNLKANIKSINTNLIANVKSINTNV